MLCPTCGENEWVLWPKPEEWCWALYCAEGHELTPNANLTIRFGGDDL